MSYLKLVCSKIEYKIKVGFMVGKSEKIKNKLYDKKVLKLKDEVIICL